jgi:hypothetical protein
MRYTKISPNTFAELQLNAGILLSDFDPETGEFELETDILGATTGGMTISCVPTYSDFGEDIDNCPKNMMELKQLDSWECTIGGTFLNVSADVVKLALGAADIDETNTNKITPRRDVTEADFTDVWWVGDYSDKNGETKGGYIAVHLMNALSTGGFSLRSGDKAKGQFDVTFTGHVSMAAQDVVPMEFYVVAGTDETAGG